MFKKGDLVHLPERLADLQEDYGIVIKIEKREKSKFDSGVKMKRPTHYYWIWWLNDQKDTREDNIWAHAHINILARGKYV